MTIKLATRCVLRNITKTPTILTAYGPHQRCSIAFDLDEGMTKQEFKDECDINIIMKRYEKTGVLEFVNKNEPQYVDVTGQDFQDAMQLIADARTLFEELPASVRLRFDNDPAKLLDFVHDDSNQAEAAALGLLSPEGLQRFEEASAAAAERSEEGVEDTAPPKGKAQAKAPRSTEPERQRGQKNPPPGDNSAE